MLRGARGMWIDDVSGQVLDWNVRMGAGEPTAGTYAYSGARACSDSSYFPSSTASARHTFIGAAVAVIGEGGASSSGDRRACRVTSRKVRSTRSSARSRASATALCSASSTDMAFVSAK